MYKNIIGIEGMACGMCEAHIADAIRGAFPDAKKVKVSRRRKNAVFVTQEPVEEGAVKAVIDDTGYRFVDFRSSEA